MINVARNIGKRFSLFLVFVIGGVIGLLAAVGGLNPLVFLAIIFVLIALLVIIKRPIVGLYGWIVFLPVQLAVTKQLIGVRLAISDMFFGGTLIALLLVVLVYNKPLVRTSLSIYLWALLAMFMVGTLITYQSLGYVPMYTLLNKDLGLLILIGSFLTIVFLIRSNRELLYASIRLLLISGFVVNILTLFGYFLTSFWGIDVPLVSYEERSSGLLVDPNAYGGYLTVLFIIQLSLIIGRQALFSPLLMKANSLLLLLGVFLTFSRSAWLGLVVGLVALLWFYRARLGRIALTALPFLLIGGAGLIFLFSYTLADREVVGLFSRVSTIESRWQLIQTGLQLWKQSPVFGIGVGRFFEVSPLYLSTQSIIHNTYVWLLVETGVVGFAIFILLLLRVTKNLYTAIKRMPEERGITIGIFGAFVAMLGFMIGIEGLYQRHLWLLFAFSEILYRMAITPKPKSISEYNSLR